MTFGELEVNQRFYLPATEGVIVYRKVSGTHYTNDQRTDGATWPLDQEVGVVAVKLITTATHSIEEHPVTIKFCDLRPGDKFRRGPDSDICVRAHDDWYICLTDPDCKPIKIARIDEEVERVLVRYRYRTARYPNPLPDDYLGTRHTYTGDKLVATFYDQRSDQPYVYIFVTEEE